MTFRPARPMLMTLGTLAIIAVPAWAQSVEPSAFPPPPPIPPFVPPPEPLVVAPDEPGPRPIRVSVEPPPMVPPPIVAPTTEPPPILPPPVLPPADMPLGTPRIPASIQSRPRFVVPIEPGELKPAHPGYVPNDSVPFWLSPEGGPIGGPLGPDMHRSLINEFELLPFGLAVQAPSFIDQAAPI